jgi:hypothetical protein
MRELKLKDIYKLSHIIDKMQIKADINKILDDAKKSPDAQAYVGGQMALILVSKLHLAQKEMSVFLSDLTDLKPEEIDNLNMPEALQLFKDLFRKNDMSSFFNSAVADDEKK